MDGINGMLKFFPKEAAKVLQSGSHATLHIQGAGATTFVVPHGGDKTRSAGPLSQKLRQLSQFLITLI
jgi:hypothetical protein